MPRRQKTKTCYCDKVTPQCSLIEHGEQTKCCHCSDNRSSEEKSNPEVYIDDIGILYPKNYNIKWPFDLGYCPNCRQSRISSAVLYDKLKQVHNLLSNFNHS